MSHVRLVFTGIALVLAVALAMGLFRWHNEGHAQYLLSLDNAERGFAAARKSCESFVGEQWGRCIMTALATRWRAIADAEVARRNTPEAYRVQRITNAGATLLIQMQECSEEPRSQARAACEADALGIYREALTREAGPETVERNCSFSGCPRQIPPTQRVAVKGRGV